MDEYGKCEGSFCGHQNEGEAPHTCPFKAEIGDDYESECNCCDECQGECAMEV